MSTYGLKYTQYMEKGGATLQIRVYVKDWTGASYGMAHITGAALQIVGGRSDVLTPYIKTAFSWSMADCWDEGVAKSDGTECVNAQNEKCGRWEEFYTPDATKFRVELWAKATPTATSACIWKGYVTPDSWSENMIYRGSVTITARDMLGALQDSEFNLTGRVSVLDIVQGALSACQCPMDLSYTAGHFLVNSNGGNLLNHTIAATAFAGDKWSTALEDTLESLGLVLRWNGTGSMVLTSLRYLPTDTMVGSHVVEFVSRSGLRELSPALKSITETFDVEMVKVATPDPGADQFSPTGGTIRQEININLPSGAQQKLINNLPAYTLTQAGGEGWSGSLAVPPPGNLIDGAPRRTIFFPTDITTEGVYAQWYGPRVRGGFAFSIQTDGPLLERVTRSGAYALRPVDFGEMYHTIKEFTLRVEADVEGTVKYLQPSGAWGTSSAVIKAGAGVKISVSDSGGAGVRIVIVKIDTENTASISFPMYAALDLALEPFNAEGVITEWKTTTQYDQNNNVTITRSPTIGSAGISGCVDFFENVLAMDDQIAADEWNWPGASSFVPLAVMIQAQVLVYHSAAASVFTGTAHDKASPDALALPGWGYSYYQRNCLPVSGTFDFASGFLVQANLREFYTWEDVWGSGFDPDYTQASGSGKGSTSATGAGGSSISQGGSFSPGAGVNYFQINSDRAELVELKSQFQYLGPRKGLIFEGVGENETSDADLYVKEITVGNSTQRVLYSPLPLITLGDQIVGSGTPGGGGGGGVDNLYKLEDVYGNFTTGRVKTAAGADVSDGQALVWNSGLSKWVAGTVGGGGGTYYRDFGITLNNNAFSVAHDVAAYEDEETITFDPDSHSGVMAENPVEWGAAITYGVNLMVNNTTKGLALASSVVDLWTAVNGKQPAGNYLTSVPLATDSVIGGFQTGFTQSGKNYPVQLSSNKAYVYVPWTDTTYSNATTSAAGLMSAADKTKLNGIAEGANNYSLPTASSSVLGGIKIGTGLTIDSSGVVSVTGQTQGTVTRVYVGSTAYNPDSSGYVSLPAYPTVPTNVSAFTNDAGYITSYTNTWRNVYTGGTSRVGTGTDTKAINFAAGSNVTITYEAAGTGSGQSGSANYFNVKIAASMAFSNLTSHPTTIAGYGITDAKIANGVITLGSNTITPLTSHQTLYNLVINNSAGTAQITYKPGTSGTYSLTLTKAMVGLSNVENTALSTWAGTTNITTLGTITSGTWSGTTIGVTKGGTGKTSIAAFAIIYASAANTYAELAPNTTSTRKFLRMTGTGSAGAAPAWDTVTKTDVGLGNVPNWAVTSIDSTTQNFVN